MKYIYLLCLPIFFGFTLAQAQTSLSVDEALKLALKNNYDISIAKNDALISQTNNSAGNAGMLPNIDLNGSANYTLKDVHQELSGGTENNYNGSGTTSLGAGAELTWTLFDGGKMFVTKRKLNEIEALGELRFREQVLQTVSDVISAYYNIVKQKQQLNSINQTIDYNLERVKISETAFNSGLIKKTDLLQAKIDLNVNKENAINQQSAIVSAKRELALILAMDSDNAFEVSDSIVFNYSPNKQELMQKIEGNNSTILAFQKQLQIEQLVLKESNRAQLPRLNFNAGYYYSQTSNTNGSILFNRNLGPQLGASLSIPLFHSGDLKRQIDLSQIGLQSAKFNFENIKIRVNTELQNALTSFENQQQLLDIERENFKLAKENLEITLQRMRLGEAISLEGRQAQQDYVQSATRLINFQFNLKLAETKLKQLMGEL